ncbi:hypothetical protein LXA43DRAFT_307131 [Ganoderma leucocontextum]|nr:hypothetical protein LXA43DRAFT_307131 [Ganoderma leucocontextum]
MNRMRRVVLSGMAGGLKPPLSVPLTMTAQSLEASDEKARPNGKHPKRDTYPDKPETHIHHLRIGVWDFYEEVEDKLPNIPLAPLLGRYRDIVECVPYVIRMLNDVLSIPGCAFFVAVYAATQLIQALIPATSIW